MLRLSESTFESKEKRENSLSYSILCSRRQMPQGLALRSFTYWNLFQIILNAVILFIGFRNVDDFPKRTGHTSMIIYSSLFILSMIGIVIFVFTSDNAEAGWGLFGIPLIVMPILIY